MKNTDNEDKVPNFKVRKATVMIVNILYSFKETNVSRMSEEKLEHYLYLPNILLKTIIYQCYCFMLISSFFHIHRLYSLSIIRKSWNHSCINFEVEHSYTLRVCVLIRSEILHCYLKPAVSLLSTSIRSGPLSSLSII